MKRFFYYYIIFILANNTIKAQVPVFEEPRHRVVLLNKYVRLIDVHIPPHDTTLYHRHSTPSAIVFLTKNMTGSQLMGGVASSGQAIPGNTFFADYGNKPIIHRVWNQDSIVYHVMDIELLNGADTVSCPVIKDQSVQLAWEQKIIRMYTVHISVGNNTIIKPGNCPHLLILIDGSVQAISGNTSKKLAAGDFIWCAAETGLQINNTNTQISNCALLELK